jgi:hypothetical protein
VDEDGVVEELATFGVALVHRPGLADGVLQPVLSDIVGQQAGDRVEDPGTNLQVERAPQVGRVQRRHVVLHGKHPRRPTAPARRVRA